jgi:methionyl-tRNA formyltransferase
MKNSAILLGSKPGSVIALSILLERSWDVKSVVTTPKYDNSWIEGINLEQYAISKGIEVFHDQKDLKKESTVDFVISYMYRNLVIEPVRKLARRGAINFHAGPLPRFGGWAFYNIAILENVNEYGCTCHYMDSGFDTGPIFKIRKFRINPSLETAVSLERRAQEEMIKLFHDFCIISETNDKLPLYNQEQNEFRYMKKEEFEKMKQIPDDADEEMIDRYARSFWYPPYECAYIKKGNINIEVIPKCVKENIASLIHLNDLDSLKRISNELGYRRYNFDKN